MYAAQVQTSLVSTHLQVRLPTKLEGMPQHFQNRSDGLHGHLNTRKILSRLHIRDFLPPVSFVVAERETTDAFSLCGRGSFVVIIPFTHD